MKIYKYLLLTFALTFSMQSMAAEPNPYLAPNNTWISISGTVNAVNKDAFFMDYGNNQVIVEMDDGDRDADAYVLLPGDEVIVNGVIDDDFFETTSIEAASVHVKRLNATYYASALDEEDYPGTLYWLPRSGEVLVQGRVTSVEDSEFTVDEGLRTVKVDVDAMPYNPLDDQGFQKVAVGDLVMISGELSESLFEDEKIEASAILKIDS